jgi:hypothetical protein
MGLVADVVIFRFFSDFKADLCNALIFLTDHTELLTIFDHRLREKNMTWKDIFEEIPVRSSTYL